MARRRIDLAPSDSEALSAARFPRSTAIPRSRSSRINSCQTHSMLFARGLAGIAFTSSSMSRTASKVGHEECWPVRPFNSPKWANDETS
jgi:hypothetical protein